MKPLTSERAQNCMQSRRRRYRRGIGAIATRLTNKEDVVDSRGENEREEAKEKETAADRGYTRDESAHGDFARATAWNHVATLHNIPVISDRHLTHCPSVRFKANARVPRNAGARTSGRADFTRRYPAAITLDSKITKKEKKSNCSSSREQRMNSS